MSGNHCDLNYCWDQTSSSDWLFGLWPGPPQRFEPTGTNTKYQNVLAGGWPCWGSGGGPGGIGHDLAIGAGGAPGGLSSYCFQGGTYRGTNDEICGGTHNGGAMDVEVWYPR